MFFGYFLMQKYVKFGLNTFEIFKKIVSKNARVSFEIHGGPNRRNNLCADLQYPKKHFNSIFKYPKPESSHHRRKLSKFLFGPFQKYLVGSNGRISVAELTPHIISLAYMKNSLNYLKFDLSRTNVPPSLFLFSNQTILLEFSWIFHIYKSIHL